MTKVILFKPRTGEAPRTFLGETLDEVKNTVTREEQKAGRAVRKKRSVNKITPIQQKDTATQQLVQISNYLAITLKEVLGGATREEQIAAMEAFNGSVEMPYTFTVETSQSGTFIFERQPMGLKFCPETDTIEVTHERKPLKEGNIKFDTRQIASLLMVLTEDGISYHTSCTKHGVRYFHEVTERIIETIMFES